jgi:hypothetical protein
LKAIIEELGGWSEDQQKSDNNSRPWQKVLEKAIEKGLWIKFPFNILLTPNFRQNASEKIFIV